MNIKSLKDGMGFAKYSGQHTLGGAPSFESKPKLTPRDRDLLREIYNEGRATRRELSIAFGVSHSTVHNHTS